MGLIQAPYAPESLFERPDEDADGNTTWTAVGSFPALVELTGPALQSSSGTASAQAGTVYVPRGADVQVGDRVTWGGTHYLISGGPNFDMDHPMTGDDFGWVAYTCIGQIARWGRG
jgi:hypothetical protein